MNHKFEYFNGPLEGVKCLICSAELSQTEFCLNRAIIDKNMMPGCPGSAWKNSGHFLRESESMEVHLGLGSIQNVEVGNDFTVQWCNRQSGVVHLKRACPIPTDADHYFDQVKQKLAQHLSDGDLAISFALAVRRPNHKYENRLYSFLRPVPMPTAPERLAGNFPPAGLQVIDWPEDGCSQAQAALLKAEPCVCFGSRSRNCKATHE